MNSKILVSMFFILITISSAAFAFDFDKVRNIIYKAQSITLDSLTPFDGSGSPTSSPTWFSLGNLIVKRTYGTGFIFHLNDGSFKQRISATITGDLNANGIVKPVTIRFWSDASSVVTCPIFNDQKIQCFSNKGHISIYRQDYRWSADINKYSLEVQDEGIGFQKLIITGYDNSDHQVFKITMVEQWFKFTYYSAPRKTLRFAAVNGTIDYINTPAGANPNMPFDMNNYTDIRNFTDGKIAYSGGYAGSMELVFLGAYNTNNPFDPQMDKNALRFDTVAYLVEKSFSDCPVFNSTDAYCILRFGYQHAYKPTHEDRTLWKVFFNIMTVDISHGRATITAGINSPGDLFKISGMNVTSYVMQ